MPANVTVVTQSPTVVTVVPESPPTVTVGLCQQGPPGPPGDAGLPDPAALPNGQMLAVADGEYVAIDPPAGTGDMQTLIYDPRGIADDTFNLANLTGSLDGGVFS